MSVRPNRQLDFGPGAQWMFAVLGAACLLVVRWWDPIHSTFNITPYLRVGTFISLGLSALTGVFFGALISDRAFKAMIGRLKKETAEVNFWVFVVCFLFFCALIWINRHVLHGFMNSADEHSCYFLAECIRLGRWWVENPPMSDFFEVVHIGNRDGKWFSVYPPGWPLIWAAGISLGLKHGTNPILAVLSVLVFYRLFRRFITKPLAMLALVFLCTSPFFLFTNASYFSHTACLLCVTLFYEAYFRWRKDHPPLWGFVMGTALGYGLLTRYLTMTAMAFPIVVYEVILLLRRKTKWSLSHSIAFLTVAGWFCFNLYYNHSVTGRFLEAPNHFYHSWERLGFHGDYTWWDALIYVFNRLMYLTDWSAPALLILYLISLFVFRWKKPAVFVQFSFLYPLIGYFLYYSWGGNQYGPRYLFEGFPFLVVSAVSSAYGFWQSGTLRLKKFIAGILLAALIMHAFSFRTHAIYYEQVSRERKALYVLAEETLTRPSIVYIHGFLADLLVISEEDAIRNHPTLSGKILYAHDKGADNVRLMKAYPDREHYSGTFDRKAKVARLTPLEVRR